VKAIAPVIRKAERNKAARKDSKIAKDKADSVLRILRILDARTGPAVRNANATSVLRIRARTTT
jgi:hypothetical protein